MSLTGLPEHDERYVKEEVMKYLESHGEKTMSHPYEAGDVKNIFHSHGGHGGHEGGLASALPLLLAGRADHHGLGWGAGGFGAGLVGGVLGGLLFGGRRGGLFDGDCGGHSSVSATANVGQVAFDQTILNGIVGLTAAVPTNALQTQNVVAASAANVKDSVQNSLLATSAAIGGVKDAVQNVGAALAEGLCRVNQNVSEQACSIKEVIVNDGDRTRALLQQRFQLEDATEINKLNAKVIELQNEGRNRAHHDELKMQITNTNTAVAAQQQGQFQAQFQAQTEALRTLIPAVNAIIVGNQVAQARADNANLIIGNTGATTTGAQTSTASPINVR